MIEYQETRVLMADGTDADIMYEEKLGAHRVAEALAYWGGDICRAYP